MFYFFKRNKKWADWRRATEADIDKLSNFFLEYEYYSVPLTSRLSDGKGRIDISLLNRNALFIEEKDNGIISTVMFSPEGVVCPVFTSDSTLEPLFTVFNDSSYSKKRYLTLMGLQDDIRSIELVFRKRNKIAVDYDLLITESSSVPSKVDDYIHSKGNIFTSGLKIHQAQPSDLDLLMPLRCAYEIEEVVLNPSNFNEPACRTRFLRTISSETVIYAEINGVFAGTCCISSSGFKWGQIGGVYTKPEYRSKGLSALLMSNTAKHAKKKGLDLMLFVKKDNLPALRLYSNCGFRKTGNYRICYLESR